MTAHYRLLDPSDESWMAFAASMPDANIFHHPAWTELLSACYGYRPTIFAVDDAQGKLWAGVPIMKVRGLLGGTRWVSLPYSDYCEPLYSTPQALDQLTDSLVEFLRGSAKSELRWQYPERDGLLFPYSQFVLHRLKLTADSKQAGRSLDSTHRQNIRAAKKNGLRIEQGTDLDTMRKFFRLQLETRQRKGLPAQPWTFFRRLQELIMDRGLGFVMLAYKDDACLAGGVFLRWNHSLMCKYAASREETLELRPNNLIFWTGICWGCENGITTFDMGRSDLDNQGLRDFKTGWGAQETPLFYTSLSRPPQALKESKMLQALQYVIRRSPLWVCETTGRLLYGRFG